MGNSLITRVAARWLSRQASIDKLALRQKTLMTLMQQGGTFGILSAYTKASKHDNQTRHGQLVADLQKMGYHRWTPLKGEYQGVAEKSILIPRMGPQDLFTLARKYGQDSTIYKSPDGVIGLYYTDKGYAEVAVDADAAPAMQLHDKDNELISKPHRDWSFQFGFLWDQHVPWDGRNPVTLQEIARAIH